eukprot:6491107-Amphidinium_carterae.4
MVGKGALRCASRVASRVETPATASITSFNVGCGGCDGAPRLATAFAPGAFLFGVAAAAGVVRTEHKAAGRGEHADPRALGSTTGTLALAGRLRLVVGVDRMRSGLMLSSFPSEAAVT